jgi:hypothetical protein
MGLDGKGLDLVHLDVEGTWIDVVRMPSIRVPGWLLFTGPARDTCWPTPCCTFTTALHSLLYPHI